MIVSTRLRIVTFSERHLTPRYVEWLNDPEIMKCSENRHRSHTLESCAAYWRSFEKTPNRFWAIEAEDPGLGHIGNITTYADEINSIVDIGILIGERRVWGQGYGAEAWIAMCEYLFETGVRKITAGTIEVNERMLGIMRKVGMCEDGRRVRHFLWEGREVDMVHTALFRSEWVARDRDGRKG